MKSHSTHTNTKNNNNNGHDISVYKTGDDGNNKMNIKKFKIYDAKTREEIDTFRKEYEASFIPPPFTYKELKDAIPPHLFERNTFKSFMYLNASLSVCSILFYFATWIDSLPNELDYFSYILWPIYWALQGIIGSGVWIIAHECGHNAFSPNKYINEVVGYILHIGLLVPYHSWRISHSQHHAGTGHMERDQAFVPMRRRHPHHHQNNDETTKPPVPVQTYWRKICKEAFKDSPMRPLIVIIIGLSIGWPLHLFTHLGGKRYNEFTCHFLPSSPIFKKSQKNRVLASNIGLILMLFILYYFIYTKSFWIVTKYYFIPYLIIHGFLILITLLHHTDVHVPHYNDKSWSFVRGALATVDRDYGWFFNIVFHHINDSHVVHHLFSQIPHYNAIQATPYIKAKLGHYYLEDNTPFPLALWRIVSNCIFVDENNNHNNNTDILFYRRQK